jgi:PAS domain S-box-containing protein
MGVNEPGGRSEPGTITNRYRHLIEHIQDAVVEFELVDSDPIVRDVNNAFVEVFGYRSDEIRGEQLNEWLVPEWLADEARELDRRTSSGEVNYRRVKRETETGLREFLYRGIPYGDSATRSGGFAVYTDLTEITRTERRLQVMNRVLRHNLRNKANVVSAYTARLLDDCGPRTAERTRAAAVIEAAAHDLETLAQETQDIRKVLGNGDIAGSTIDCVPLIRRVAREYRRTAPVTRIETRLPDSMEVRANSDLRFAVDNLLHNAIEHNPAAHPRVRIRLSEADATGWMDMHVDDNGPRIPAKDRDVVTGDAEITPTQHGSGLGLWLVKWTIETFGGELSFGTSDFGGNSVRVRLPRR